MSPRCGLLVRSCTAPERLRMPTRTCEIRLSGLVPAEDLRPEVGTSRAREERGQR